MSYPYLNWWDDEEEEEAPIEYTEQDLWVLNNVNCCACCEPLKGSKYLNFVTINKRARWEFPTWGNITVEGSHGRAGGYVCDACIEKAHKSREEIPLKFALEIDKDYTQAKYHLVSSLVEVPPIRECPKCRSIGYFEENRCQFCGHTWKEEK